MNLISFLTEISDKTGSNSLPPVFYFFSKKYSVSFFHLIKQRYKKNAYATQSLNLIDFDQFDNYKIQLETAFLGNGLIYWVTNFSELDSKKQHRLSAYFERYQGPHHIYFFADKLLSAKIPALELMHEVGYEMYVTLFSLLFPEYAAKAKNSAMQTIFKKYKTLSLEQACLLMNYAIVLSSKMDHAVEELFEMLIIPEKSLFTLSGYFFAKKDKEFFTLWSAIKEDYPPVFWTTFWSEQLFRAYCFIELMYKKDFVHAKKSSFRLPFLFIQRGWKYITLPELKEAHGHIKTIDNNIKNGFSPYFEHFYLNFFM